MASFCCKSCIFKRKCVFSVTQSGSSNVLEVFKMWILEVFNEQMFYIQKIFFHKKPNTWIKHSWRIKVRNVSEISIPFPIINSWPSQEANCSQMKPAASPLLQPLFLRKCTFVAGNPLQCESLSLSSTWNFLVCLWQLRVRSVSFKGEGILWLFRKWK